MELFFTGRYTDRGRRTIAMAGGGGGGGVRGCVVSGRILFDYFSISFFSEPLQIPARTTTALERERRRRRSWFVGCCFCCCSPKDIL
jgi:hypothetical protein